MTAVAVSMKSSDRLILFVAEGAGLGRIPFAPGTFGSLWGIGIGFVFQITDADVLIRLAAWVCLFAVGIPLCHRAALLRKTKDPGSIVWDELTAFPLVYALCPLTWPALIAGFVAFRVFDIWKPWPVKPLERLPGGLGIMADDQAAAAYAAGVLAAMHALVPTMI